MNICKILNTKTQCTNKGEALLIIAEITASHNVHSSRGINININFCDRLADGKTINTSQ